MNVKHHDVDKYYSTYDSLFDRPMQLRYSKMIYEFYNSGSLSVNERRVLRIRYGLVDGVLRTLGYTATKIGVTREIVRYIEWKIFVKLRMWCTHKHSEMCKSGKWE